MMSDTPNEVKLDQKKSGKLKLDKRDWKEWIILLVVLAGTLIGSLVGGLSDHYISRHDHTIIANITPAQLADCPDTTAAKIDSVETEPVAKDPTKKNPCEDWTNCELNGVIMQKREPVMSARVWVVIEDRKGNRFAKSDLTDKRGEFHLESIYPYDFAEGTESVMIYSSKKKWLGAGHGSGKYNYLKRSHNRNNTIDMGWLGFIFLPVVFLCSLVVCFMPTYYRFRYKSSLFLAIVLSLSMIAVIAVSLGYIKGEDNKEEVVTMGFGTVFQGQYAEKENSEWMFSFTTPPKEAYKGNPIKGFGVPLWVMLISVIGAGLYTISIVVWEISHRPRFYYLEQNYPKDLDPEELAAATEEEQVALKAKLKENRALFMGDRKIFRDRMRTIMTHQFYIIFAPLGSIFVYQILVASESANQDTMVAVVALGSGLSLSALLKAGIERSQKLFEGKAAALTASTDQPAAGGDKVEPPKG
jgi:hypothetical protein